MSASRPLAASLMTMTVVIMSRQRLVRRWPGEARRAVEVVRVDTVVFDTLGFAPHRCTAFTASLRSLSANPFLSIVCSVGPGRNLTRCGGDCEAMHLPWPVGVNSLKWAIAESRGPQADNRQPSAGRPGREPTARMCAGYRNWEMESREDDET
jgi:hypothetical protein